MEKTEELVMDEPIAFYTRKEEPKMKKFDCSLDTAYGRSGCTIEADSVTEAAFKFGQEHRWQDKPVNNIKIIEIEEPLKRFAIKASGISTTPWRVDGYRQAIAWTSSIEQAERLVAMLEKVSE